MYKEKERMDLLEAHKTVLRRELKNNEGEETVVLYSDFDKFSFALPTRKSSNLNNGYYYLKSIDGNKAKIADASKNKFTVKIGRIFIENNEDESEIIRRLAKIFPFHKIELSVGMVSLVYLNTKEIMGLKRPKKGQIYYYINEVIDGYKLEGIYLIEQEIYWKDYIIKY